MTKTMIAKIVAELGESFAQRPKLMVISRKALLLCKSVGAVPCVGLESSYSRRIKKSEE